MSRLKKEKKEFALPLPFCSILALSGLRDASPRWWGAAFFAQSTESNANLFKCSPRNTVLPAIWPSLSPVKSAHTKNPPRWVCSYSLHLEWFSSLHFLPRPRILDFNLWTPSHCTPRVSPLLCLLHPSFLKSELLPMYVAISYAESGLCIIHAAPGNPLPHPAAGLGRQDFLRGRTHAIRRKGRAPAFKEMHVVATLGAQG